MDGGEVSVESLALEYYQRILGYRGYTCENGILSMIFSLIFWDIIFMPVEGVFETPYQVKPLDFGTFEFYAARRSAVHERLAEIENGGALEILQRVDTAQRPLNTLCIGVNWEYPAPDLEEIVAVSNHCLIYASALLNKISLVHRLCCFGENLRIHGAGATHWRASGSLRVEH